MMSDFKPEELRESVEVLGLQSSGSVYIWNKNRTMWAKVEQEQKKNLFSQVGIGVKSIKFTIWKQSLSLNDAFSWQGKHCFITDINEIDRMCLYCEVTAALIEPKTCTVTRLVTTKNELNRSVTSPQIILTFPGCLVEKYMGYSQEKPQAVTDMQYVLVTPKVISLEIADLIKIDGVTYNVQIAHTLDEYKNEYEIVVKKDVGYAGS
jgi:hypothetical protein